MELLNKINLEDLGVWGITCSIIACLLYFAFRSYLNKKFENIATIEDTRKINTIVEEIKTKYQADTENLKAQLSILTNKNNVIFQEEKNALVSFLSEWNIWYQSLDINFLSYDESNYFELIDMYKYFNSLSNKAIFEKSKIELFIENKNLINSSQKLLDSTKQFNNNVSYHCSRIHYLYGVIKDLEIHLDNESIPESTKAEISKKIISKNDEINSYIDDINNEKTII